jgi:hypothetical protein
MRSMKRVKSARRRVCSKCHRAMPKSGIAGDALKGLKTLAAHPMAKDLAKSLKDEVSKQGKDLTQKLIKDVPSLVEKVKSTVSSKIDAALANPPASRIRKSGRRRSAKRR